MNYVLIMHSFKSQDDLCSIVFHQFKGHTILSHAHLTDQLSQTASTSILKHVVKISIILECEELLDDIRV